MSEKREKKTFVTQNAATQLSHKLKGQFMHNNYMNFSCALLANLLIAAINLAISWLLQQIIDAATGNNQIFNLFQLLIISTSFVLILTGILVLDQKVRPCFVEKAMYQYKNMVFSEISKKVSVPLQQKIPQLIYQHYPMMLPALKKTISRKYLR